MNPIDTLFQNLRAKKQKAFIPFISAGDPDLATTAKIIGEFARRGASLIEVGFPYSDPIADGSVIQASYTRALNKGLRVEQIFGLLKTLKPGVPMIGMVSYSLVFHRGPERFLEEAVAAGLAGAVVPDLPVEEAGALAAAAKKRDFKIIQLVTPTTPQERALRIAELSTGFLYCVSVVGITGERTQIPPSLMEQLRWLRARTQLPLCVGFGVSRPEHVKLLREEADGVIVGSALVRPLEKIGTLPVEKVIGEIGAIAESLASALN